MSSKKNNNNNKKSDSNNKPKYDTNNETEYYKTCDPRMLAKALFPNGFVTGPPSKTTRNNWIGGIEKIKTKLLETYSLKAVERSHENLNPVLVKNLNGGATDRPMIFCDNG